VLNVMEKVIYAVYGSNLLKERFLAYIKGGFYEGRKYNGCINKEEPIDLGCMYIPHRLYFAKNSSRWDNKGVAFITSQKEENTNLHTLVRFWKVTEEQFEEIQEQEGKDWYNRMVDLGEKDGLKILTITGDWLNKINLPSSRYIEIIKKGLKETTKWTDKKIENYLKKFIKS